MFDELVETKISGGGKVTVKRYITDEETIREMEFAEACEAFVVAERKWEKIDRRAKGQDGIPDNLCEWFDAFEARYQADKRLWLLFIGRDRSPKSNKMYCEYRRALLSGKSLRADA